MHKKSRDRLQNRPRSSKSTLCLPGPASPQPAAQGAGRRAEGCRGHAKEEREETGQSQRPSRRGESGEGVTTWPSALQALPGHRRMSLLQPTRRQRAGVPAHLHVVSHWGRRTGCRSMESGPGEGATHDTSWALDQNPTPFLINKLRIK